MHGVKDLNLEASGCVFKRLQSARVGSCVLHIEKRLKFANWKNPVSNAVSNASALVATIGYIGFGNPFTSLSFDPAHFLSW